ncbi:MAG: hypothetical protein WC374_09490 [Phycisphaerae bacterium]|jgi:predicted  nucleic acid-binding Zn-ribbon protein
MNQLKTITLYCMLCLLGVSLIGCKGKADENKPMDKVKAEADTMTVEKLKATAMAYKNAVMAKQKDAEKLMDQLKNIPAMEAMSSEAKKLQADVTALQTSIKNLKDRFTVYYDKLKEKGGDTSGLEL